MLKSETNFCEKHSSESLGVWEFSEEKKGGQLMGQHFVAIHNAPVYRLSTLRWARFSGGKLGVYERHSNEHIP